MTNLIQHRYAMQLSTKLERFSVKHSAPYKINFRCPVCGDSATSKSKARGWLNESVKSGGNFWYSCFNCAASMPFKDFLEFIDPAMAKEYAVDAYMARGARVTESGGDSDKIFLKNTKKHVSDPLALVKKISQLKADHPAKLYVDKRQIPSSQHFKIYYAPKFKTWINQVLPDKFPEVKREGFKDEPRLLLPFIDEKGKCFGVAARSFDPNSKLRYISIMFEERPKIFGLQSVDMKDVFYIVEGALDSMFLKNAVAMAGSDGGGDLPINGVYVFDNEPRNAENVARMRKKLKEGRKVVIWPSNIVQKDINEMWLAGVRDIENILEENTYFGLSGEMRLSQWSKVDEKHTRNRRNRF